MPFALSSLPLRTLQDSLREAERCMSPDDPTLALLRQAVEQKRKGRKTRGKSELEQTFLSAWAHVHGDRLPEREYRFSPLRRWRFDFAWPHAQVAVEIQGGMFKGRGHQRPRQYAADCEKFRAAQSLGWIVLPYTTLDIRNRLAEVVEEVWETLEAHSGKEP